MIVTLFLCARSEENRAMLSRRLITLLATATVAAAMLAWQSGCGDGASPTGSDGATAAPGDASASAIPGLSSPSVAPGGSSASLAPGDGAPADADALEAVRTVKHLCDLVSAHRLRAAEKLLAGAWVWPRRELRQITRLRLVSARVQEARQTGDVVLLADLRATVRGPSPLHKGVNTLFFTLGRDGTTGGWLITAVTTSP